MSEKALSRDPNIKQSESGAFYYKDTCIFGTFEHRDRAEINSLLALNYSRARFIEQQTEIDELKKDVSELKQCMLKIKENGQ